MGSDSFFSAWRRSFCLMILGLLKSSHRLLSVKTRDYQDCYRKMVHLRAAIHLFDAIAPPALAADWDNTGLLVEPPVEEGEHFDIKKILVTNDLTIPVFDEARKQSVSLIYTYHPLLFKPVKTFTMATGWTVGVALKCIRHNIAVYSAHTAIDAIPGGNNDWLIDAFADFGIENRRPLEPASFKKLPVSASGPAEYISVIKNAPENLQDVTILKKLKLPDMSLTTVIHSEKLSLSGASLIYSAPAPSQSATGFGRFADLKKPIPSLDAAVDIVKRAISVDRLRVVRSPGASGPIRSIAVCAGSGSGVFGPNASADLLLTGELAHHDLLNAAANGSNVILAEHSRSERGFMKLWAVKLQELLRKLDPDVSVVFAQSDADPVDIL